MSAEEDDETTQFRMAMPKPGDDDRDPTLVVLSGRSMGRTIRIRADITIGRSPDVELVIDDDGVSREHCTLRRMGQMVWVEDLGSTNGTFIDDYRLKRNKPRQLEDGQRLRVGPEVIFKFGLQDNLENEFLERLYANATRDWLTGLPNRRAFVDHADQEVAWHRRQDQPLTLLMIDIDHFKLVNDTHGHQVGDEVLKQLADVLRESLRAEDLVARWGGEEFVVLLRKTPADEGKLLAERLRVAVEQADLRVPVTISLGVVTRQGDTLSHADALVGVGDKALYDAKAAGRNRVVVA